MLQRGVQLAVDAPQRATFGDLAADVEAEARLRLQYGHHVRAADDGVPGVGAVLRRLVISRGGVGGGVCRMTVVTVVVVMMLMLLLLSLDARH